MRKSILTLCAIVIASISFAQGLKLTEAATLYLQLKPMWFMQPDQVEPSKAILKKAKAAIDVSYAEQTEKNTLTKPKDLGKLNYYRGVIYLDYMFLSAFDETIKKEVEDNADAYSEIPMNSLKKCKEITTYYDEDIAQKVNFLRAMSIQGGVKLFEDKEYKGAFEAFKGAVELSDVLKYKDTLAMFNAGMAAENSDDYVNAIKYYEMAADNNYLNNSNVYINIIRVIDKKNNGPSDEGYAIIEKAKAKYPGDISLIIEEFNYHNSKGNTTKAQESLEAAIAKDPRNPIFHYSIGATFDNLATTSHEAGKVDDAKMYFEKAVASYLKAIELDPKMANAYYNLGVLYNNESYELNKRIQSIKDVKLYNDEKAKSEDLLKKAIPYLVKSHELQPNDVNTLKLLKSIYFTLEGMETQYSEAEAKLKALGQ
jgi:tetratricopeptide (TPR) repeat protein